VKDAAPPVRQRRPLRPRGPRARGRLGERLDHAPV